MMVYRVGIVLPLLLMVLNSFSQGGWDIDFIPIDSLSTDDVGRDVKIDFTKNSTIQDSVTQHLMFFISREDTGSVTLDNQTIKFVEKRSIHLDWGFYDEQYLESLNFSGNQIFESIIP